MFQTNTFDFIFTNQHDKFEDGVVVDGSVCVFGIQEN